MKLEERKKAMKAWGVMLGDQCNPYAQFPEDRCSMAIVKASQSNQWFTFKHIYQSVQAISSWLQKEPLNQWLIPYAQQIESIKTKRDIGLIMAGNIPMVGFHDLLCVLISGHNVQVKCASDDAILLPAACSLLIELEPRFREQIRFVERLEKPDAVVATGGNNSSRYFEYYFGKKPHIIRKNRNGVAVLVGNESKDELVELGSDIFSYFGLGCRNVSKLYIPHGYDFSVFFQAMEHYSEVMQHHKYMNNHDYHNTLFLLNSEKFLTNNFLIVRENRGLATPVSVLHYEYYSDNNELNKRLKEDEEKIQCITGKGFIPFGKSQSPALTDYADGVDVLQFLTSV